MLHFLLLLRQFWHASFLFLGTLLLFWSLSVTDFFKLDGREGVTVVVKGGGEGSNIIAAIV